jgi:hypothetical protein
MNIIPNSVGNKPGNNFAINPIKTRTPIDPIIRRIAKM